MRRHLVILLIITLGIRAWLFISYPMGGLSTEDNQAGQRYLIDEILRGNLLIGNLRYHTGYALVMSSVAALTAPLGRLDDRVFLLVQVSLSALIPFMVYDTVRRRWSARAAFIVALCILLDPFGLQWAHFYMPEWLVAFCLILALWLIERAGYQAQQRLRWTAAAGLVLGVACLSRWNFAPSVVFLGLAFFAWRHLPWRKRLAHFITLGFTSAGLLAVYMVLIHYPSTGVWTLSCISGNNLATGLADMGVPMVAENGPITTYYLEIVNLPPLKPVTFYADSYPLWRKPANWVTPDERAAFLARPRPAPAEAVTVVFPGNLYYYLGPCEADSLLAAIHIEAVTTHPGVWLSGVVRQSLVMLVQHPQLSSFNLLYLPRHETINFHPTAAPGFAEAQGGYYNGQIVFEPGLRLFSSVFDGWNLFKWLTPMAVLWAFWRRDWYFGAAALLLIVTILTIAIAARPEPRYYAIIAPLYPLLIGGMLAAVIEVLLKRRTKITPINTGSDSISQGRSRAASPRM